MVILYNNIIHNTLNIKINKNNDSDINILKNKNNKI